MYWSANFNGAFLADGRFALRVFGLERMLVDFAFFFDFAMFYLLEDRSGDAFQDADVALGLSQDLDRLLVLGIFISGNGILHALKLDDYGALLNS